jgi:threonyl-tRNA synthetase
MSSLENSLDFPVYEPSLKMTLMYFAESPNPKKRFRKSGIWEIVYKFYGTFGLPLKLRLSLRDPEHPEKYLGNQEHWDKAESVLKEVARENSIEYYEAPGEAAFYAPKLDFMAHDSIGREWQVATIQLDVNMPERFDLTCINEKGEKERIVMIHAAIMGSIDRFLSIIIEHFGGAFPLWLSPVQIKILPIGESQLEYSRNVFEELNKEGIRVELDDSNESLGKKIRNFKTEKVPYALVIGDKEVTEGKVTIESRDNGNLGQLSVEELVSKLKEEISERK